LVPAENLVAVPADLDVQESWKRGLANRPDLKQAELAVERGEIDVRFAKNQLLPALDLQGSYGYSGLSAGVGPSYGDSADNLFSGANPRYSYGVVLRVPLGNLAARSRYKSSKAQREQTELELKKLEQQVLVQIDDAVKAANSSFQQIESTREARLFAEEALAAEQKKLANGKSTNFQVLQFQRDLTSARYQEIRALAAYNNALAQLAFLEGTTLERHKVDLELK
jgi:outer membrane protein TolC